MRISYKTSLLTELQASLKSIIVDALLHCIPILSQVFDDCKYMISSSPVASKSTLMIPNFLCIWS